MASPMQKLRVEVDSAPKPCPRCDNPVRTSPAVEYADLNALRRIQTQAMVPRVVFGIFLSAVNFGAGCPWTGLTFGCVPIINLIALPLLWLTERTGFARDLATNGSCLCVLASLWLFGGGPGAAGLIAFVYIEQIQHRVEEPSSRASLWWVAFTFLFSLALCVVERTVDARHVTPQQTRLPETWYAILDWFCANFPGLLLYVTLSQLMDELTKSRRLLEESKAQAERLNEQLLEQQQRLQTERTLAHGLIANVFPRDVAASLIALFEQHANSLGGAGPEDAASAESRETPVGQLGVSDVFSSISCPDDLEPPEPAGPWDGLRDRVSRILTPCYRPFAAILFGDIVGFTSMAAAIDPSTVVQYLDAFFGCVDEVCEHFGVEKVKTIGDCYMAVRFADDAAAPAPALTRVLAVADRLHGIAARSPLEGRCMSVRVGVHVGPVVTGIIGKSKFAYDLWGDAVNVASRMESTGVPGSTQISVETYAMLADKTGFIKRGSVDVKGKGTLSTYFSQPRPHDAANGPGAPLGPGSPTNAVRTLADLLSNAKGPLPLTR